MGPNVCSGILWWSLRFQDKERPSDDTGGVVSERGATQSWEMQGPPKMMRRVCKRSIVSKSRPPKPKSELHPLLITQARIGAPFHRSTYDIDH